MLSWTRTPQHHLFQLIKGQARSTSTVELKLLQGDTGNGLKAALRCRIINLDHPCLPSRSESRGERAGTSHRRAITHLLPGWAGSKGGNIFNQLSPSSVRAHRSSQRTYPLVGPPKKPTPLRTQKALEMECRDKHRTQECAGCLNFKTCGSIQFCTCSSHLPRRLGEDGFGEGSVATAAGIVPGSGSTARLRALRGASVLCLLQSQDHLSGFKIFLIRTKSLIMISNSSFKKKVRSSQSLSPHCKQEKIYF